MKMTKYTDLFNPGYTPQTEAIPGREEDMKRNSAGGFAFKLDAWKKLDRFLILGSDSPTYYTNARNLTKQNATNILKLIKEDGVRVVNRIVEISTEGRAYKNDPALFALALALAEGDDKTKTAAKAAVSSVARTGTHLFTFVDNANELRGWGNALKKAVASWYENKSPEKLAYQITKYQQRNGWSHRDVLRLAHPKANTWEKDAVYGYAVNGELPAVTGNISAVDYLMAVENVKKANSAAKVADLIKFWNLPREVIPTEHLNSLEVWEALLQPGDGNFMPLTAMIRNLGAMTSNGFLKRMSEPAAVVAERLTDQEALIRARVHPIQILAALMTYKSGHGARGNLSWTPVGEIIDALDEAFYLSFGSVRPTGKRRLLALDVSGSMTAGEGYSGYGYGYSMYGGPLMNVPGLSPRIASSALAMVAARTEKRYDIMGFSTRFIPLNISPRQRLDDVLSATHRLPFGGTDCAQPMRYALEKGLEFDSFEVYTDNETWEGDRQPVQALNKYRKETGIPATLVVNGMTANDVSIADPNDAGMLDVVGFDSASPNIISDFVAGRI